MRWGLVARSEDRGLGTLSWEIARHLNPDTELVIIPSAVQTKGLHSHLDRFPEATVIRYEGSLPEQQIRTWLHGLDVVLMLETAYDWRMIDWARDENVTTVIWAMPEYVPADPHLPQPDVWWAPTGWRLDHLPANSRRVPVPVPADRWPTVDLTPGDPPRWLHVAGARAAADRNGTNIVLQALGMLRAAHHVTLRAQDEPIHAPTVGRQVRLEVHTHAAADYWTMYPDFDGLLLPRRYGGLSLPALEAMGAGLALVMPDVEPQMSEWPILPIVAEFSNHVRTTAGQIPLAVPDPRSLARIMDDCAHDRERLANARLASRRFAEGNSWQVLGPRILGELHQATGR